ncbi:MAG: hypothetical protein JO051_13180 [Acidobacteriaceae bacterium]|nr:hypothetical protein [Acidobacteriaceae bacterium]
MPHRTRGALFLARSLALTILSVLLFTSFAGPIHKHSANQQDTCLICHVADPASVVDINTNAGKPLATTRTLCSNTQTPTRLIEFQPLSRTPRAPPCNSSIR